MNKYSLEQIKEAFIPDDRRDWVDPKLERLVWDELDVLAWKHPKGGNYFACIEDNGQLYGMIFQMNAGAGRAGASCDLCYGTNDESGVKSAFIELVDNPRRKLGIHVCSDLACSQRVRGEAPAVFMYETISTGRRIERLQEKLGRFAQKVFQGKPSNHL